MKKVRLEDVTGEARANRPREAVAQPEATSVGREKTLDQKLDDAASQAGWGIVASFAAAAYLAIVGVLGLAFAVTLVSAAQTVLAVILAVCGWMMLKRSRLAAMVATGLSGAYVAFVLFNFGGGFLSLLLHFGAVGAMATTVSALVAYHQLLQQQAEQQA